MIRPIVRDVFFLGQKSEAATMQDLSVGQDLQDTLAANRDRCVGMAANMIGIKKRIIIVNAGFINLVMYNPVIVKKDTSYETEEGCLSLDGVRISRWNIWTAAGRSTGTNFQAGQRRSYSMNARIWMGRSFNGRAWERV